MLLLLIHCSITHKHIFLLFPLASHQRWESFKKIVFLRFIWGVLRMILKNFEDSFKQNLRGDFKNLPLSAFSEQSGSHLCLSPIHDGGVLCYYYILRSIICFMATTLQIITNIRSLSLWWEWSAKTIIKVSVLNPTYTRIFVYDFLIPWSSETFFHVVLRIGKEICYSSALDNWRLSDLIKCHKVEWRNQYVTRNVQRGKLLIK